MTVTRDYGPVQYRELSLTRHRNLSGTRGAKSIAPNPARPHWIQPVIITKPHRCTVRVRFTVRASTY